MKMGHFSPTALLMAVLLRYSTGHMRHGPREPIGEHICQSVKESEVWSLTPNRLVELTNMK